MPLTDGYTTVRGHCPACGSRSLFVGDGGYLTCSWLECSNPAAATEVLSDGETEHVVAFTDHGFTVRHPLHERINDALLDCDLHAELADTLTEHPGYDRAVARRAGDGWTLTPKGTAGD